MASFKTHLTFGIALGILSVVLVVALALSPPEWRFLFLICLAAIVGAVMPDMDSDTGVPFHITFGTLAVIAGGLTFFYMLQNVPGDFLMIAAYTLGAIFTVWVVIGALFKKFTAHRGMAHSIPAAVLSGLICFTIASRTNFAAWESFLLGLSLFLGFVLHLLLDEVCAAINFHGKLFIPNKSLGSALKFFSHSAPVNVFVYVSLTLLLLGNGQSLYGFILKLLQDVRLN